MEVADPSCRACDAGMFVFFLVHIPVLAFVSSTPRLELGPGNIEIPGRLGSTGKGREDA